MASNTRCWFMNKFAHVRDVSIGGKGELEGAGLAPPRTCSTPPMKLRVWRPLAPLGGARSEPGGSQEAPDESRKLLVCSRKLPGRPVNTLGGPRSPRRQNPICFTRFGGLPEAIGARNLCILRGPAASHKPQGRESYVFYEVRGPQGGSSPRGTHWLRLRV